jgi:biopolymer transport protein ExbB
MSLLELIVSKVNSGGAIMWLLLALSAVLWGLINRYQSLLSLNNEDGYLKEISMYLNSVVSKDRTEIETIVYEKITVDERLIKAMIAVAPLMGLLGTVGGMIETFASLGTMSMFKSGGGIAGGISQALLTTQLGLIVAVPALLYLKVLEKKRSQLMSVFKEKIYSKYLNSEGLAL